MRRSSGTNRSPKRARVSSAQQELSEEEKKACVKFSVECDDLRKGESLAVSGSCDSLGNWDVDHVLHLYKDKTEEKWIGYAKLPETPNTHQFKLAVFENDHLRAFENLEANRIVKSEDKLIEISSFSRESMRRAWIQPDEAEAYITEAIFCSYSEKGKPIEGAKFTQPHFVFDGKKVSVPVIGRSHATIIGYPIPLHMRVGITVSKEGVTRATAVEHVIPEGCTRDMVELRVDAEHYVRLTYLIITPMPNLAKNLLASVQPREPVFARFIGHRGHGSSRVDGAKDAILTENTLMSFLAAGRIEGAGGVEFDVQLTSDNVPVIYHDIFFPVQVANAVTNPLIPVPINSLSYEMAAKLRPHLMRKPLPPREGVVAIDDIGYRTHGELQHLADVLEQPPVRDPAGTDFMDRAGSLPTLHEMFSHLPTTTGFDVEIKYPDTMKIEHNVHPVERNAYLNRIVQLVIDENQPERWLFFSSFDVDLCHMIERKQPCYHAFLLSVGHPCHCPEDCNRMCPALGAVEIAHEIGLLGMVTDSKAILADNGVLTRAHELGLKLLTYGGLNNNPAECQKQIDIGVDSIISDYLKRIITGTHLPPK